MKSYFKNKVFLTFLISCVAFFQSFSGLGINLREASLSLPHIVGKPQNGNYLYVTAGDKLYCIGNQKGEFPKVGFHVPGQMGGIWMHPIKLLDGFDIQLKNVQTGQIFNCLPDSFITYSFLNKFIAHPSNDFSITRTEFVPDGLPVLVVEFDIQNNTNVEQTLSVELNAFVNVMPVWLSERLGVTDQPDTILTSKESKSIYYFKDTGNIWLGGIGFNHLPFEINKIEKSNVSPNGIKALFTSHLALQAKQRISFQMFISGSLIGTDDIYKTIHFSENHLSQLFNKKKQRYEKIAETAAIEIPDTLLQNAYLWGKYATDWLRRDVNGLGKGLSAGLPDYPWFFSNDQATAFQALVGTIDPQLFYDSYQMLKQVSNKENENNGSIVHEISSNGVVYAKNRMEESQLHIITAWEIFKWTGSLDFLRENYAFGKKTWIWLHQHINPKTGYIQGYGGTEIEGLNEEMLDVQINTCLFLEVMSKMANVLNDKATADTYLNEAAQFKCKINEDWWIESENRYADFISSKEKALKIIDDALRNRVKEGRNGWAKKKLEMLRNDIMTNNYPYKGYVVYYNPSGLLPMANGIADENRSKKMLASAPFFTNKFGLYITGIERPDDVSIDERSFVKDSLFTYNRAVMPSATNSLAEASLRLNMPDTALTFVHKTLNSFSYATPGTIYEVSPDYGMFVQAWNVCPINIPLIKGFFGVNPNAYEKEITIRLNMPKQWNIATLKNLLVGDNKISIFYTKSNNQITLKIISEKSGWKFHIPMNDFDRNVKVNNHYARINGNQLELLEKVNLVQLKLIR